MTSIFVAIMSQKLRLSSKYTTTVENVTFTAFYFALTLANFVCQGLLPDALYTGFWVGACLLIPAILGFFAMGSALVLILITFDIVILFVCLIGYIQAMLVLADAYTAPSPWLCFISMILLLIQVILNLIRLEQGGNTQPDDTLPSKEFKLKEDDLEYVEVIGSNASKLKEKGSDADSVVASLRASQRKSNNSAVFSLIQR